MELFWDWIRVLCSAPASLGILIRRTVLLSILTLNEGFCNKQASNLADPVRPTTKLGSTKWPNLQLHNSSNNNQSFHQQQSNWICNTETHSQELPKHFVVTKRTAKCQRPNFALVSKNWVHWSELNIMPILFFLSTLVSLHLSTTVSFAEAWFINPTKNNNWYVTRSFCTTSCHRQYCLWCAKKTPMEKCCWQSIHQSIHNTISCLWSHTWRND